MTATVSTSSAQSDRTRAVVAASIGNALEWFDFAVFGFFAVTIAKVFFPSDDPTFSLLLTYAGFGVTFFIRPLGAVVLGNFADKHGRKSALTLTIGLMMLGTTMIALAPPYAAIGIGAPILILSARLIQGFSAGGEFGSATAFLAEQNPAQRGFYASWQFASQGLTTMLATGFGAGLAVLLAPSEIESWGWRVPFIFGLLIGPVAYYIRTHLDETMEFKSAKKSETPLQETLTSNTSALFIGFGLVVLTTVATYTVLFMPTFAVRQLGLPAAGSFVAALLTGALQFVLVPIVGALSDRHGRFPIAFVSALALLLAIYPMFAWLASSPTLGTLLAVQAILGVLISGYMGGIPALMSELFPTRLRTTGLSISYSFGVAVFGGFAPFINAWLIQATGSKLAPSFYLMLAAAVSLWALLAARRLPAVATTSS
jgi:MHS family proline/betaine transporter-like MFS transporter